VTGIVTRDKAAKTRRVEVMRLVRHPRYGKILRRRTVCTAHDEDNQSHSGDLVEIEESRPLSRTKRWKLLRVVKKGQAGIAAAEDLLKAGDQGISSEPGKTEPSKTEVGAPV
jgi:small subunit ribosomal protein S17